MDLQQTRREKFRRFAWFVVAYNLLVIVWGAFVRASKSGDGCGASYPFCNGMIVPHAAELKTIIEFSHRVSSGIALLLVVGLLIWAFLVFPRKHLVRRASVLSLVFILTEAAIGAGIVLFKLVAHDDSIARAFSMSAHLVNTFILLTVLGLTAFWANGKNLFLKGNERFAALFGVGLLGMFFVGISGGIAALGDTLFPVASLQEGLRQDLSETAHFLIRLRVWHPILSIVFGVYFALLAGWFIWRKQIAETKKPAVAVILLVAAQLAVGTINLLLLAPIGIQLIHLLLADLLWLSIVLLAASVMSQPFQPIESVRQKKSSLETAAEF